MRSKVMNVTRVIVRTRRCLKESNLKLPKLNYIILYFSFILNRKLILRIHK